MNKIITFMTLCTLSLANLVIASESLMDSEVVLLIDEGGGVGNNSGDEILDLIERVCITDYSCKKNYKSQFQNAPDDMARQVILQDLRSKLPN